MKRIQLVWEPESNCDDLKKLILNWPYQLPPMLGEFQYFREIFPNGAWGNEYFTFEIHKVATTHDEKGAIRQFKMRLVEDESAKFEEPLGFLKTAIEELGLYKFPRTLTRENSSFLVMELRAYVTLKHERNGFVEQS